MPAAPKRPCRKPGCPALHTNASGYCDVHQLAERKAYDATRESAAQRGYDQAWRRLRAIKLRANPMCETKRCKHVASLVHHKDKNPHNNSQDNLMSVCTPCHELIHAADRFAPRAYSGGSK
jgi:5-methylcytosine-specific restriction enzyme A